MVRRHDDEVEVRLGRIGEGVTGLVREPGELDEGPSLFLWRGRIWRVLRVQARWLESAAWWEGPGVRAARGDWEPEEQFDSFLPLGAGLASGASGPVGRAGHDVATGQVWGDARGVAGGSSPLGNELEEFEVWRVEAASGQFFSRGIYELVHATGAGHWRMRAVVD